MVELIIYSLYVQSFKLVYSNLPLRKDHGDLSFLLFVADFRPYSKVLSLYSLILRFTFKIFLE